MDEREQAKILDAIAYTEPITFIDFVGDYPESPEKGDRSAWSRLFGKLERLEKDGLVEITRDDTRRIESLQLSEAGAHWVRAYRETHYS